MIGIEIIGTGEFLELFDNTVVDLRLKNPLFADDDIIPGSISLPFEVPGGQPSPRNSRLLKNPDVVSNLLAPVKTPARLWYEGNPWKTGELIVQKANPRTVSLNFRFGLTTTSEEFKTLRIRDLVAEDVVMNEGVWHKKIDVKLLHITANHKVTINGKDYEFQGYVGGVFINGINYGHTNTFEGVAEAFRDCIMDTFPNGVVAEYTGGNQYFTVRVPDPNTLDMPLSVLVDDKQYWLLGSTLFEAAYNAPIQLWLNGHFHAAGPLLSGDITTKIRFPVVCNKLYDKDLIYLDAVNLVDDTGFVLNKPVANLAFEPDNRTSVCPFVLWSYVLDEVLASIGIQGTGDFLTDDDFLAAMIPHSNSLDVLTTMTGTKEWVGCKDSFNIRDFVPDWTVPEFIKALQKRFNVGIDYNDSTKRMEFVKREGIHADRTYKDITAICGTVEEVEPPMVTGVRIKTVRNTKDLLSSTEDKFESGDPNLEIPSEISGWTAQQARSFITGTSWTVPVASIRKDATIVPAMLFYTERSTAGTLAVDYGTANIDLSDCTFVFAGAGGMATIRWKRHLRFLLNRKLVPVDIAFEFRDLLSINWKQKVRPVEGLNCFINTISVRLTMQGVERSKCELWTTDLGILP